MKNDENLIEQAIKLLKKSNATAYKIWQGTGIGQTTIKNYSEGKSKPTPANARTLINYFNGQTGITSKEQSPKQAENSEAINQLIKTNSELVQLIKELRAEISALKAERPVVEEFRAVK
jgi:hypothetical protein